MGAETATWKTPFHDCQPLPLMMIEFKIELFTEFPTKKSSRYLRIYHGYVAYALKQEMVTPYSI